MWLSSWMFFFFLVLVVVFAVAVNVERCFYSFWSLFFIEQGCLRACVSSKYLLDKYSLKAYKSMLMIHLSAFCLLCSVHTNSSFFLFSFSFYFHSVAYNFIYFIPIFSVSLSFILFDSILFVVVVVAVVVVTPFLGWPFFPLIIPLE